MPEKASIPDFFVLRRSLDLWNDINKETIEEFKYDYNDGHC